MSRLRIREELCIGCGSCAASCGNDGLRLPAEGTGQGSVPEVTENCILCGICVDTCPEGAIYIEREEPETERPEGQIQTAGWKDIWVFAQQQEGELLPVALELVGKGCELADQKGCRLAALLAGAVLPETGSMAQRLIAAGTEERPEIGSMAQRLIAAGADEVICCPDPCLSENPSDLLAEWICGEVRENHPEIILFGATSLGRELAPGVAARLRTADSRLRRSSKT